MNMRNFYQREATELKKDVKTLSPPTLAGRHASIEMLKEQSSTFYEHVE